MRIRRDCFRYRLITSLMGLILIASIPDNSLAKKQKCPCGVLRPKPLRADLRSFPWKRRQLIKCFKPSSDTVIPVAFFDADSTLRVSRSGSPAANHRKDVILLPMVASRLCKLMDEGYLIAVISNQGGVAKGFVSYASAQGALRYTCRLLSRLGIHIHWFDFADVYDGNRKPKTGMAMRLNRRLKRRFGYGIDWKRSFMVGDSAWKKKVDIEPDGHPGEDWSNSDRGFAEAIRKEIGNPDAMVFHHSRDFFGWKRLGVRNFHRLKDVTAFLKRYPDLDPCVNGRY